MRAAEATAATAAMMVAVTAAAVAGLAAVGGVGTREIRLQRGRWWVENVENVDGGATVAVRARKRYQENTVQLLNRNNKQTVEELNKH